MNEINITAEEKNLFLKERGLSFYLEEKKRDFSVRAWRRNRYKRKTLARAKLINRIMQYRSLEAQVEEANRIDFVQLEVVEGFYLDVTKSGRANGILASSCPVFYDFELITERFLSGENVILYDFVKQGNDRNMFEVMAKMLSGKCNCEKQPIFLMLDCPICRKPYE